MKTCCKCKIPKPLADFNKNRRAKDGLSFECRNCTTEYAKIHRLVHGDVLRQRDNARYGPARKASYAKYVASDKGKAAKSRAAFTWQSKHPARKAASTAVGNALQAGRLERMPCFVCGKTKVEGHHPDYSRPLDVVWLCTPHHKATHRMAKEMGVKYA